MNTETERCPCGETITDEDYSLGNVAEMVDPSTEEHYLCHYTCGQNREWVLA